MSFIYIAALFTMCVFCSLGMWFQLRVLEVMRLAGIESGSYTAVQRRWSLVVVNFWRFLLIWSSAGAIYFLRELMKSW